MAAKMPGRPGDVVDVVSYDGGDGYGIVLATSAHAVRLDRAAVLEDLLAECVTEVIGVTDPTPYRAALDEVNEFTWRSVTQREIDLEVHCCENDQGCSPGSWCSEGAGRSWVRIVSIDNNTLYLIDEELEL